MNTVIKPIALVNENATTILIKEIGVVDTIRFLNQFTFGHGNYTEARRKMVDTMTLEEIISGIEAMNKE
jgi:uncharacterized membrane protein YGL010W